MSASSASGRMPRGIFLNTGKANCSIFESGRMVYECIMHSDRYKLDYLSLDMFDTAFFAETGMIRRLSGNTAAEPYRPECDFWVINWHFITMEPFLPVRVLQSLTGLKFSVVLELAPGDPLTLVPSQAFDGYIALEPNLERTASIFPFPRPLEGQPRRPQAVPLADRSPVIGSFGFDTPGKGFELLVEAVNREFDRATVRINVPAGTYTSQGIHAIDYATHIEQVCRQIARPGVDVIFSRNFFAPEEVIDWCAANDLNCFMYTRQQPGLSATTDQAILSGRPLLTVANDTFRHIHRYIPPYPELSLKQAMKTTHEAVAQMQQDWSKQRFAETFEAMLGSFGLLAPSPVTTSAQATVRRLRVLHVDMGGAYADDVSCFATRLRNAMARTGHWQVTSLACPGAEELRGMAGVVLPDLIVLSSADAHERASLAEALSDVPCAAIVVTDDVASWSNSRFTALARRPIIPFFTVTTHLRTDSPAVWLLGFSDPASGLEIVVDRIVAELSSATILVEADAAQVETVTRRVEKLQSEREPSPRAAISVTVLPSSGPRIIEALAASSLIVVHNDPTRSQHLESLTSLAMITERAVVFSGSAAGPWAQHGTRFESASVSALIGMGLGAQIKLLADYGEWQIAARLRALASDRKEPRAEAPLLRVAEGVSAKQSASSTRSAEYVLSLHSDSAFLHAAYCALMDRAPDPEGLTSFLGQLAQGQSRKTVLLALSRSPEAIHRRRELPGTDAIVLTASEILSIPDPASFVDAAYWSLLGRAPDAEGLATFLPKADEGRRASVLLGLAGSPEAQAKGFRLPGIETLQPDDDRTAPIPSLRMGVAKSAEELVSASDDATFIERMYETLLARAPDPEGAAHFRRLLRQGRSRESLLVDVSQSPEAQLRGKQLHGMETLIRRERDLARSHERRAEALCRSLRVIDSDLHRLGVQAASAASSPPPTAPPPLHFATTPRVPPAESTGSLELSLRSWPKGTALDDGWPIAEKATAPEFAAASRTVFVLSNSGEPGISPPLRRLVAAWERLCSVRVAWWDGTAREFRIAHGGSAFVKLEQDSCPAGSWLFVSDWLQQSPGGGDLGAVDVIMQAHRLGLQTAFVFHGTDALTDHEDAEGASEYERFAQALLLADALVPATAKAEDDLVAYLTQHQLASWSSCIRSVPWPDAATGDEAWARYAAAADGLLRSIENPASRVASLYYWIDSAAGGECAAFAVQLAQVLAREGVSLIPVSADFANRGWTGAPGAPETVSWSAWKKPGTDGAPAWILAPAGLPCTLAEWLTERAFRDLRVAVCTTGACGEKLARGGARQRAFEALNLADKVLFLSAEAYAEFYRFLLGWRGKVCSAEDRFKCLPENPRDSNTGIHYWSSLSGTEDPTVSMAKAGSGHDEPSADRRWKDFARRVLSELATDRLRDRRVPLPQSKTNVYDALPYLRRRPKLSVCLSTYNRAGWVRRNLENIYSQISSDRDDVEVLVVDNTSPDATPQAVEPFRIHPNFHYHRNARNVGMLGNLAVTAQRARGEYIWILGDDDLTRAGCINKVLDVLHQHPRIALVYLNYGYTSEPDPLGITDLPAFLNSYNVLEPAGPDELGKVKDLAAKSENFYTAIYSHVYRRDHALRAYCQNTSGRPFSTMLTCIPTSYYVLHYMPDEPAYWIGEPCLVVNSNVSWVDYGPLFDLEQLPRAWDVAERNGANAEAVDRRRANRLWLIEMMWKDLFENDRAGNSPWFSAPRVLMRLKHLPEIDARIPALRDIYTRAHRNGHPAARMKPSQLFSAFSGIA